MQHVCFGFVGQGQAQKHFLLQFETLVEPQFREIFIFYTIFKKQLARLGIVRGHIVQIAMCKVKN
jgi:hypothetical protein